MNTRRDQVQAHRFMTRRIVSAMLSGEPETNDLPMRRLGQALFASAMVGAIVLAVVGVIGVLSGQSSELSGKTLVVEKETGANFVYDPDGNGTNILYPVANYTSARLILGDPNPPQRTMSHNSLDKIPRGPEMGIPNAPASLPAPSALLGLPWSQCDLPSGLPDKDPTAEAVVGIATPGASTPGDDQGLLVNSSAGTYLIYRGHKLRIPRAEVALALGFNAPAIRVTTQFLNAMPSGPDLSDLGVGGVSGTPVSAGPGQSNRIGSVYKDENGQNYIMTNLGVVRIGETFAKVRLATHTSVTSQNVKAAQVARYLAQDPGNIEPAGYPLKLPTLINQQGEAPAIVCAQYDEHEGTGAVSALVFVGSAPPELAAAATKVRQSPTSVVQSADQIIIPPGRAVLVQPSSSVGADNSGSTVYLVTDNGVKYPLARSVQTDQGSSVDAVAALGFGSAPRLNVPLDMLDLLPTGVTLDPAAARQPVDSLGGAGPSPSATSD